MRIVQGGGLDARALVSRETMTDSAAEDAARLIIADVRGEGDAALRRYTERFDGVRIDAIELPETALTEALAAMPEDFARTLRQAADNIRAFHARQVQRGFVISEADGVLLGQRVMPLQRVGMYVPGGTAAYPSTVLMNAIPARIAGVPEIVMTTPPGRDGNVDPGVLAAAKIAGVGRVFRAGGAQAIAALAYGTESVPRVDKIVGPGNAYVAAAKRLVYGQVDIDMIAGPSEILIVADDTADASCVAADLLSQAEHDRMAASILVTTSEALALAVQREIGLQMPRLRRADICGEAIEKNGWIFLTRSMEEAIDISNQIAPEHLELFVEDPFRWLSRVRDAGSVFLGGYAPEALGDYFAGPNHTLPTNGTARFSSPLSVDDFIKKSSFLYYSKEALAAVVPHIADFARREGLDAHAESVSRRFREVDSK